MNLHLVNNLVGLAVCFVATLAFSGPMVAGAIETQCRAAVRAEMKGPNCKVSDVSGGSTGTYSPCGITSNGEVAVYLDKISQCVARGGPAKR
jgi:hypothetical protein